MCWLYNVFRLTLCYWNRNDKRRVFIKGWGQDGGYKYKPTTIPFPVKFKISYILEALSERERERERLGLNLILNWSEDTVPWKYSVLEGLTRVTCQTYKEIQSSLWVFDSIDV